MKKRNGTYEFHTHEFPPVFDGGSRILILGSFPSVKSREQAFYYGHPQNRFWKVISALTGDPLPLTVQEKKELLWRNGIALWDVIESCEIIGSGDSSIRNVVPTDLGVILKAAPIEAIYANGSKAGTLYRKYQEPLYKKRITILPSTSPANAAWSLPRLIESWKSWISCF